VELPCRGRHQRATQHGLGQKLPSPITGLMAVATSEAVMALISGTTTTRSCWVSSAGLAFHQHGGVHALHLQVVGAGHALGHGHIAAHKVKAKPLLNTSRKSSPMRRAGTAG
jgi:uncharacterized ParB-like nuclease family protein